MFSASLANVTVKVTGLKPSDWGWGLQPRRSLLAGTAPWARSSERPHRPGLQPGPPRGACLCGSARLPLEFLGPPEPGKLEPVGQPVSAEEREPRAPSPGNSGWSGGRSPGPAQGRAGTWRRLLAPLSLGLPGWGGAGTAKVAVAGAVNPGGARPVTHLSGVGRRADSAPALRPSSCGPRQVAGAPPLPRAARVWRRRAPAGAERGPGVARPRTRLCSLLAPSLAAGPGPDPARCALEPLGSSAGTQVPRWRRRVRLRSPSPSAALPVHWPRRLCGAERSWAERGAHCSLAFRKATLAAGRRDAGLTHARARVSARLWGRKRGSDGRRRRGGPGEGEGLTRDQPLVAPAQGTQTLGQHYQGFCPQRGMGPQRPRAS